MRRADWLGCYERVGSLRRHELDGNAAELSQPVILIPALAALEQQYVQRVPQDDPPKDPQALGKKIHPWPEKADDSAPQEQAKHENNKPADCGQSTLSHASPQVAFRLFRLVAEMIANGIGDVVAVLQDHRRCMNDKGKRSMPVEFFRASQYVAVRFPIEGFLSKRGGIQRVEQLRQPI